MLKHQGIQGLFENRLEQRLKTRRDTPDFCLSSCWLNWLCDSVYYFIPVEIKKSYFATTAPIKKQLCSAQLCNMKSQNNFQVKIAQVNNKD